MEDHHNIEAKKVQILRARLQQEFCLQEEEDVEDGTLRRFLCARSFNVDKAFKFLDQHLKWARTFKPLGYIPESQIANEMRKEKIYLQGVDKHGRPIAMILASKHCTSDRNLEEFKRFVVYGFDKAVASLLGDQEKFVLIADLKDYGLKNVDFDGYCSVLKILQDHYPERLGKLYIVHVPMLFWQAWRMVRRVIDPNVRDKIVIVRDDNQILETLLTDIDQAQLPDKLGGKLPLLPIQYA